MKRNRLRNWASYTPIIAAAMLWGMCASAEAETAAELKASLTPTHPRLFLTQADLPRVRERVKAKGVSFDDRRAAKNANDALDLSIESAREWFDRHIANEPLVATGKYNRWRFHHEVDPAEAALESAFAYLIDGDTLFCDQTNWSLERSLLFYEHRAAQEKGVHWYVYSRLKWLIAFDWIYNGLPEERRVDLMERFIRACHVSLTPPRKSGEGAGNYTTGYYNIPAIKFYLGLVAVDMPLKPELARYAEQWLEDGYAENIRLMEYREKIRGSYGGTSSPTLTYSLVDYPYAMFNFLYCTRSALGMELTEKYPGAFSMVNYLFWNMIFADDGQILEFGTGDVQRTLHKFPLAYVRSHINNLRHLYGNTQKTTKDLQQIAQTVSQMLPEGEKSQFFFYPYLRDDAPPVEPVPLNAFPKAFYFDTMGQTFMRSGVTPEDTYALFTCGGDGLTHAHLDALSFTIYKHGFQAMDTGNRPPRADDNHWAYATSTAAHNSLLIHMPDEPTPPGNWVMKMGSYTGPQRNFGGQAETSGSRVVAFETNEHYAYVAGDATRTYREDKVHLVSRQFLFLPPDVFVVYDRIVPVKASYKTEWLLHTATAPQRLPGSTDTFQATHQQGRIVVQTLLPHDSSAEVREGFQWSDGTTMPIAAWDTLSPEVQLMQGKWTLGVSSDKARRIVEYLHVMRVQKADAPLPAFSADLMKTATTSGVTLKVEDRTYEILFNRIREIGGSVTIVGSEGEQISSGPLATSIEAQSMLAPEPLRDE